MKLSHIISRRQSAEQDEYTLRKHTPWIASPLEKLEPNSGRSTPPSQHDPKQTSDHHRQMNFQQHDSDTPHFRHRHESSTIELFYDLFFVANLATFTANHEIVDANSLKNYIGFFTILWFTWLQTSLFDVRFATDSVFNRTCKAVSFGVMTGFAITGAIYDTSNVAENLKAFRALALILMVSRLALVAQYGIVLYYVREYRRTHLPLFSTMATLFLSAMVYLGTFWGYKMGDTGDSFPIQHTGSYTYIAYYVVAVVEAFSVIIISCVWRIVSFKYTHLVERVGLLTLIIMGEGIIGMTKSVSKIIQSSSTVSSSDIGVIISSVLLIYFVWVLYFDQIENDRFGTIRQQIWAILHYPLHVAILLTVEGSTALIVWNIICQIDNKWWAWFTPLNTDVSDPYYNFTSYESPAGVVEYLHKALEDISTAFKNGTFEEKYNSTEILSQITELESPFDSDEWKGNATDLVYSLFTGVENFIFTNFGIETEKGESGEKASKEGGGGTEAQAVAIESQNYALYNVFSTVYTYFPIAAGVFLVILGVLFWFGKTNKTRGEWASIAVRMVAGAGLSMMALAGWYGPISSALGFLWGPWAIPTVMLAFFTVIVLDNVVVWYWNKLVEKKTAGQNASAGTGAAENRRENGSLRSADGDNLA